jgi:hypothetical protein
VPHPDCLHLTPSQFLDWQAFAEEYGLGTGRDDIQWGILTATCFNAWHTGKPRPPTDFMPFHKRPPDPSPEELRHKLDAMFATIPCT